MSKGLLVINSGSSSIKFSVFARSEESGELAAACRGLVENVGGQSRFSAAGAEGCALPMSHSQTARHYDHQSVLTDLLDWLSTSPHLPSIAAVGHRVVHGGLEFYTPQLVTPAILERLQRLVPLAPLHQPHNLAAIQTLAAMRPDLPQVACFDTAFHHTLPELERLYALPREYWEAGIQRYGFHGLSYDYIAAKLPEVLNQSTREKVIIAHLGNGASLCALLNGKSIATTMGFTALEGLPMGTRCGALDPGVILYLLAEKQMGLPELTELLYKKSGLLGISGFSNDMRELLVSSNPNAQRAVAYFSYRIARELGSLTAALGGLDTLVFTGGIGEHAAAIREQVCAQAAWLGIALDNDANAQNAMRISDPSSRIAVLVIPTNEELMIARHVCRVVFNNS